MRYLMFLITLLLSLPSAAAQPETPVEQWRGKTVMLVGAHPDDDHRSHGTLAMLQANGNQVYIVLLTTGNVGTLDPEMTRWRLAEIRRQEQLGVMDELGIPLENYINLGYDDGLLEFQDPYEVTGRLVRLYRQYRPDVLIAFDPGPGYQRWHKTDHRAASYWAVDAARMAMWRLLFEGHIIQEGLQAHRIPEFLFWDSPPEALNTWVDISGYVDRRLAAGMKHVSQWTSGRDKYYGPVPTPEDARALEERLRGRLIHRDGKVVEAFRYYRGSPDGMGR